MKFPWAEDVKSALSAQRPGPPAPCDFLGHPHSALHSQAESGAQNALLGPTAAWQRSFKYWKKLSTEGRGVSVLGWALPLHCG